MISIIIPVYNSEKTLKRCVDSILNQTFNRDIEILLVNDGSKDSSESICLEYQNNDKRIKYFKKENGGVSSARNLGIYEAKGEYIAFVDSDDYVEPNMYEIMLNKISKDGSDIVICGYNEIYSDTQRKINVHPYYANNKTEIAKFVAENFNKAIVSSPWNKIFKKKLIKNFYDEKISLGEDLLFNIQYFKNVTSITVINEALYDYDLTNVNSLSNKYSNDNFDNMIKIVEESMKYLKYYDIDCKYYDELYYKLLMNSLNNIKQECKVNNRKRAIVLIEKYIEENIVVYAAQNINLKKYNIIFRIFIYAIINKKKKLLYILCKIRIAIQEIRREK